jgi:hypothetical protein
MRQKILATDYTRIVEEQRVPGALEVRQKICRDI